MVVAYIFFVLNEITFHFWTPVSFGLTLGNEYQETDLEPSSPLFLLALLFFFFSKLSFLHWNLDEVFQQSTNLLTNGCLKASAISLFPPSISKASLSSILTGKICCKAYFSEVLLMTWGGT